MEWEDINDIIDELVSVMDDIETCHPELKAFKAPLARAIASLRAERAILDLLPRKPANPRAQQVDYVTNEGLKEDLASLF